MKQLAKIFHMMLPRNNSLCFTHRDYNRKEYKVESFHLKVGKNKSSELFRATPMVTKCGHREGGHVHRHFDHQIGARTVHCSAMCTKHMTRTHTTIHTRFASCIGVASGDEWVLTNHLGKRIIASLFIPSEKKRDRKLPRNRSPSSVSRQIYCVLLAVVTNELSLSDISLERKVYRWILNNRVLCWIWPSLIIAKRMKRRISRSGRGKGEKDEESMRSERIFSDCRFLVCDSSIEFDYSNREGEEFKLRK